MNALIVYTHPEPESLNGYLKNSIANHLQSMGYRVIVSDLYKMNWKAVANTRDFKDFPNEKRLFYIRESKRAYDHGMQTLDIEKEQDKLMWADVVIFQFPLWWFGMPALLKGIVSLIVCLFHL